jgi:hypothetical protein
VADIDFDSMAAELMRSAKKRASATGDSVNTGSAPAVPQYRMTPDGSAVLEGWALDWQQADTQGQANAPVNLRHVATGRLIVQGAAFGALAQQSIQDPVTHDVVWIPNPAYQGGGESPPGSQPVTALVAPGLSGTNGNGPGVGKKLLGAGLALVGVGVVGWTGWRLWRAWSGGGEDDEPPARRAVVEDDLGEEDE